MSKILQFSPPQNQRWKKPPSLVSVFHLALSYGLRSVRFILRADMSRGLTAMCRGTTAPSNKPKPFSPSQPQRATRDACVSWRRAPEPLPFCSSSSIQLEAWSKRDPCHPTQSAGVTHLAPCAPSLVEEVVPSFCSALLEPFSCSASPRALQLVGRSATDKQLLARGLSEWKKVARGTISFKGHWA